MKQKVKAKHALNWLHGNICTKKCYDNNDKQRTCYKQMQSVIAGHEDFLITHKMFIQVMRQKYKVCDLIDADFYRSDPDFWSR